ncbi:nitrogen fixation protein NifX [Anaeromyxobacter sp. Fw109-5]|uniref:nitrogen fixation protein NifX n=1 Tax=Anaeromyxobacter sp. (strain Fw109-5) TaxID=404589 RepID=UPI0000ED89D3|nr:nitrogen fixation protein NifX [Anaeromyxobacter sp. Fw109-5]ABS27223.1 nitrogen fixation protein NifX [Anaeromyxobacter sp. Fw109-5]
MRIAFTSSTGERVDEHFGRAGHFWVWEVGPDAARFVERVSAVTSAEDEDDRIAARASALAGCAIVYTAQIGGPAAAKLVSRRIQPMKASGDVAVEEVVGRLQEVLRGRPPPWLRKAMGVPAGEDGDGGSATAGDSDE